MFMLNFIHFPSKITDFGAHFGAQIPRFLVLSDSLIKGSVRGALWTNIPSDSAAFSRTSWCCSTAGISPLNDHD